MTIANFCDAHYFKIYGVSKKTFKKLYMFYFETFQIILNPSLKAFLVLMKLLSLSQFYAPKYGVSMRGFDF